VKIRPIWSPWGRCYDHNFLRFSTIFGEKIGAFLKNQCYDQLFSKFRFVLSQKTPIFSLIFSAKIFLKILTSVPGVLDPKGSTSGRPDFRFRRLHFRPPIQAVAAQGRSRGLAAGYPGAYPTKSYKPDTKWLWIIPNFSVPRLSKFNQNWDFGYAYI
jgi:hypothetical protein